MYEEMALFQKPDVKNSEYCVAGVCLCLLITTKKLNTDKYAVKNLKKHVFV